jgi:hypothetical protein
MTYASVCHGTCRVHLYRITISIRTITGIEIFRMGSNLFLLACLTDEKSHSYTTQEVVGGDSRKNPCSGR